MGGHFEHTLKKTLHLDSAIDGVEH